MEDRFLDANDLFALEFNEGLVFLEVTGREITKYKPYEQLGDLGASSNLTGGTQRLEDANGDDILYLDRGNVDKVIHAGIGHKPWFIRRYARYPEDSAVIGTIPNLNAPSENSGDPYGYVDGKDSPYEDPTNVQEYLIPSGVHLSFDFYNPDSADQHQPILNIVLATYEVEALSLTNENRGAIRTVLKPGGPAPIFPAGTIDNQIRYRFGDDWGVDPVTRSEAQRRIGGL